MTEAGYDPMDILIGVCVIGIIILALLLWKGIE